MRDTIDMAREAGAIHVHEKPKEFAIVGNYALKAFEALVRADEREACANVAERFEPSEKTSYVIYASQAIRAREETK